MTMRTALGGKSCLVALAVCMFSALAGTSAQGGQHQKTFELDDMIPHLQRAIDMPPKEGVKLLLQRTPHLRTYMATLLQVARPCPPSDPICTAQLGDLILERAINREIATIVELRISTKGTMTAVDYEFERQPFPFTVVTALRSRTEPYASIVFDLPRRTTYTGSRVLEKYGPAEERRVNDETWLSYRIENAGYTVVRRFRIDIQSNEVRQQSLSLKRH